MVVSDQLMKMKLIVQVICIALVVKLVASRCIDNDSMEQELEGDHDSMEQELEEDDDSLEQELEENKKDGLKLVHVVFRHGERTPADTYPNDVYINETFYPYGWGQITNLGRTNLFASGQYLRRRFDNFLGELSTPQYVFAQSTDPDRAYMSCAIVLAGMWPPRGTALEWNHCLNWTPIPIRSEPLNQDTLLLARKDCPRYSEELENVFKLPEVLQIMDDNSELFNQLTEVTGMPIKNPDDVQSLYNTLRAEELYGLTLPDWTHDFYPDKLLPLTEKSFVLNAYNNELKRLKGGPLVKKLISDWSEKAKGTLSPKERKLFVYTGHDSTISNLMISLRIWDEQVPNYGIMTIFELYEDAVTKEYAVEIYLRNSTSHAPHQLTIPGCEARCPLYKVIELTKDIVPLNWAEECKAKDPNYVPKPIGGP